ncbi:mitotic and meiotic spindle pole body KASH domain protein Kms2 [Schizosaccharomyces osmophilus]|uniref:Mitotic and meiotic spindle pole body KASH domain protein Kms2 n=1 Tax=Schizosaccharomyces osmophilus TaxID=2545709 RepID=A0AAE9WA02_9SCHI|nr:mitotic and meiotic spindle pole body KASH domain protein Kms2 [Schizosaccharomyces osmophilus]WBW71934.1 mitotic and meiotic spindle pole body KASH domain protein Kms2 [Schizosaccharomyces osmophilus]
MEEYIPFDEIVLQYDPNNAGKVSIRSFLEIVDDIEALRQPSSYPLLDAEQRQSAEDFIKDNEGIVVSTIEIKNLFYELTSQDPDRIPISKTIIRNRARSRSHTSSNPYSKISERRRFKDNDLSFQTPQKAVPMSQSTPFAEITNAKDIKNNIYGTRRRNGNQDETLAQLYERVQSQSDQLRAKEIEKQDLKEQNQKLSEELTASEEACKSCYTQAKTWEKKFRETLKESKEFSQQLESIHQEYEVQTAHITRLEQIIEAVENERMTESDHLQKTLDSKANIALLERNQQLEYQLKILREEYSQLKSRKTSSNFSLSSPLTVSPICYPFHLPSLPVSQKMQADPQLTASLSLLASELESQKQLLQRFNRIKETPYQVSEVWSNMRQRLTKNVINYRFLRLALGSLFMFLFFHLVYFFFFRVGTIQQWPFVYWLPSFAPETQWSPT